VLEFAPLREWVAVLRRHRIDKRFALRTVTGVGMSAATTPLRIYESLRHGRALRKTAIHPSPVFVVGCARSGTTHLLNLLAQDSQFGFVTNFQALFQTFALSGSAWLQPLIERTGPGKRPMDNVALDMSGPQEEDLAIANCSRHSGIHCITFPRDFDQLFRAYVLGEFDSRTRRGWEAAYRGVLRKATLAAGGKRLVLKSPTNTGRIPVLREMFPEARFIHIHRNPYRVFQSIESAARKILPILQLQDLDWDSIEENYVSSYQVMMRKFLVDRLIIPEGFLAEVCFDDLEASPLRELERLYEELDLCAGRGFEQVRPRVETYLEQLGTYQKNSYEISDRVIDRVNGSWAFALEAFGYDRLETSAGA
jgi:hypothetical protein